MAKRRCRNCPDSLPTSKKVGEACNLLLDLLPHVTDVPGDLLIQMRRLHARLGKIIGTDPEDTFQ